MIIKLKSTLISLDEIKKKFITKQIVDSISGKCLVVYLKKDKKSCHNGVWIINIDNENIMKLFGKKHILFKNNKLWRIEESDGRSEVFPPEFFNSFILNFINFFRSN